MQSKLERLRAFLRTRARLAVAFSGGVDSAFLLAEAHDLLEENVLAITVTSPFFPVRAQREAEAFCQALGVRHVSCACDLLAVRHVAENTSRRCYWCKCALMDTVCACAAGQGVCAVADGTNADDEHDERPGRAALAEKGILSPLADARFGKEDIRLAARARGLALWDKPASACLATRVMAGTPLSRDALQRIEAAEDWFAMRGFSALRVRAHGALARIEADPSLFSALTALREEASAALRQYGFEYVTLDLQGYRAGGRPVGLETGGVRQEGA